MNDYHYADNVYNFDNPFRGATHTMLAIEQLKARQRQEMIQNALEGRRVSAMEREISPRIAQMEAQAAASRMQTEQSKAAIGRENELLAQAKGQYQTGLDVRNMLAAAAAAQRPELAGNPEMITNAVMSMQKLGGWPQQAVNIQRYGGTPSPLAPPPQPQGIRRFDPLSGADFGILPGSEPEIPTPFTGVMPEPAPQQDFSTLIKMVTELAPQIAHATYSGQAASTPQTAVDLAKPVQQAPGHPLVNAVTGAQIAQAPPMPRDQLVDYYMNFHRTQENRRMNDASAAERQYRSQMLKIDFDLANHDLTKDEAAKQRAAVEKMYPQDVRTYTPSAVPGLAPGMGGPMQGGAQSVTSPRFTSEEQARAAGYRGGQTVIIDINGVPMQVLLD